MKPSDLIIEIRDTRQLLERVRRERAAARRGAAEIRQQLDHDRDRWSRPKRQS